MKVSKKLTTVTPVSKTVALALFVLLPFVGFLLGMRYQEALYISGYPSPTPTPGKNQTMCTQEALLCPDGSYVGRTGSNCEFAPCPESE